MDINKNLNTLLAGFISTVVVSIIMIIGTKFMGLTMDLGVNLGINNGLPYLVGWLIHFIIGIIFAFIFVALLNKIPGKSNIQKGLFYGFILFILAQIMVLPVMIMDGLTIMFILKSLVGSLFGHLALGYVLGKMIK